MPDFLISGCSSGVGSILGSILDFSLSFGFPRFWNIWFLTVAINIQVQNLE